MLTLNDFDKKIIEKGKEYFENDEIGNLYLLDENTIASVNEYTVTIGKNNSNCTCPCDFNCKHMAGVLMKIKTNPAIINISKELQNYDLKKLINNLMIEDASIIDKIYNCITSDESLVEERIDLYLKNIDDIKKKDLNKAYDITLKIIENRIKYITSVEKNYAYFDGDKEGMDTYEAASYFSNELIQLDKNLTFILLDKKVHKSVSIKKKLKTYIDKLNAVDGCLNDSFDITLSLLENNLDDEIRTEWTQKYKK